MDSVIEYVKLDSTWKIIIKLEGDLEHIRDIIRWKIRKMSKKNKEIEEHLKDIKYLLAGILMNKKPNIKEVAKAAGCSDKTLTKLYPEKTKRS